MRPSKIPAIKVDIANLRKDIDYLKSVHFNILMNLADDGGSPIMLETSIAHHPSFTNGRHL